MAELTELDIIKHLARSIDRGKYPFQLCNAFIYPWECDYWAMNAYGISKEFEIKISRPDFLNDSKKQKHQQPDKGANFFYYVCPVDLIKSTEVDSRYGLMHVWKNGRVDIIKKPKRLHNHSFDNWKLLANKMYWRWFELWKEKYIAGEITQHEYQAGFNIALEQQHEDDLPF